MVISNKKVKSTSGRSRSRGSKKLDKSASRSRSRSSHVKFVNGKSRSTSRVGRSQSASKNAKISGRSRSVSKCARSRSVSRSGEVKPSATGRGRSASKGGRSRSVPKTGKGKASAGRSRSASKGKRSRSVSKSKAKNPDHLPKADAPGRSPRRERAVHVPVNQGRSPKAEAVRRNAEARIRRKLANHPKVDRKLR